jgi:hypothetical protein
MSKTNKIAQIAAKVAPSGSGSKATKK